MENDRRQSIRLSTSLPCEWQTFTHTPSRPDLLSAFGLETCLVDDDVGADALELRRAVEQIGDPNVKFAIQVLARRMEKLEHTVVDPGRLPPVVQICASLDGLEVQMPAALAEGVDCGLHLVLDDLFHFVSAAQVTCCAERGAAYRVGLRFVQPDPTSHRRWTRTLMRQSPRAQ